MTKKRNRLDLIETIRGYVTDEELFNHFTKNCQKCKYDTLCDKFPVNGDGEIRNRDLPWFELFKSKWICYFETGGK